MHGIHGMIGCCGCGTYDIDIVFYYDSAKRTDHICDEAVFDVLVNNIPVGQINLNNYKNPPRPTVTEGGDVYGGEFLIEDVGNKIKVALRCAISRCHSSITTFMMIVKKRGYSKLAVLDSEGLTSTWTYDLGKLDYIYSYAQFYREGEKVYVDKSE